MTKQALLAAREALDNGLPEARMEALALIESALSDDVKDAWQSISTAPKDGEWALVYADGAYNCAYVKEGQHPEDWTYPQCPNVNVSLVTHWMPLPPPPAAAQKGADRG